MSMSYDPKGEEEEVEEEKNYPSVLFGQSLYLKVDQWLGLPPDGRTATQSAQLCYKHLNNLIPYKEAAV